MAIFAVPGTVPTKAQRDKDLVHVQCSAEERQAVIQQEMMEQGFPNPVRQRGRQRGQNKNC